MLRVKPGFDAQYQASIDRAVLAWQQHKDGVPAKEIAAKLGVGISRARQLITKGSRLSGVDVWWDLGLPWPLGTFLSEHGFNSKESVMEAITSGRFAFTPKGPTQTSFPGLGRKGLEALCEWTGCAAISRIPEESFAERQCSTEPRIGMEFIHASWLDENNEPLRCRVTAIRRGSVYWRGVYADGRLGGSTFCDLAEFPKRIKSIVEK